MAVVQRGERFILSVNYVLMFLATFTLGLLSPLAVLIAYVRRGGAAPVERSHYDFQIRSFWHDVGLVILGAVCGFMALAGGVGTFVGLTGVKLPGGLTFEMTGWITIGLAVLWGILWVYGFINLIFDSLRGLMRLASGKAMGDIRPL
jgi:uncharacterized membrane protein